jgi:hypothetical protein
MTNQQFAVGPGLSPITLSLGGGGHHTIKMTNNGAKPVYFNFGLISQNSGSWPSFVSGYAPKGRKRELFDPYEQSREDLWPLLPGQSVVKNLLTSDGNETVQVGTLGADTSTLIVQEGL